MTYIPTTKATHFYVLACWWVVDLRPSPFLMLMSMRAFHRRRVGGEPAASSCEPTRTCAADQAHSIGKEPPPPPETHLPRLHSDHRPCGECAEYKKWEVGPAKQSFFRRRRLSFFCSPWCVYATEIASWGLRRSFFFRSTQC
jgi:hypothetical protein